MTYDDEIEELKNELHCQLFHQTDENAKVIVKEFYEKHPLLREWITENADWLIFQGL